MCYTRNMIASVVIDAVMGSGDKVFDYLVPEEMESRASIGARVFVPFGPRQVEGFILDMKDTTDVDVDKLKSIEKLPDEFVALKLEVIKIAPLICDQFKLRLIDVLRLFVPATVRTRKRIRKVENKELKGLDLKDKKITLTEAQINVVNAILSAGVSNSGKSKTEEEKNTSKVFLLHGVTGSGKTEVYMNVISKILEQGKSAIMLVPEIGLTPQVLANFRLKFGDTIAMIHSGLSPTEKYDQWVRLHTGEVKIAIGARSAIFAPAENLGVIIIDEEHDTSYFSESNPRFSTHEIAKLRASFNNCPVVLGSATPSIDSYFRATGVGGEDIKNASPEKYKLLELDRRALGQQMPKIQVVDMTAEIRAGNGSIFSRDLRSALANVLDAKKQAMIFLNRRGFSSYVMCKECGWVAQCENCDVSLVWHKDEGLLKCHYCPARFTKVNNCKKCASTMLKYGAVGTQKLVEELEEIFPNTKIFRLDADNTKTKDSLVQILSDFASTTPSILVGTQMIAKGHDFPNVELVGLVDTDNSLHFSDYRATERTFALVTQVAGRSGRLKEIEGASVFLQTYKPNHYVYRFAANYDYKRFFEKELNMRMTTKYPPFTTIVRILITGEVDQPIRDLIQKIMGEDGLKQRSSDFIYLGAMKSPLGRIQNKFRYQILARFDKQKEKEMLGFMGEVLRNNQPKNPKMHVFLEINPQNMS